jgi:hypothetical protein
VRSAARRNSLDQKMRKTSPPRESPDSRILGLGIAVADGVAQGFLAVNMP